MWQVADFGEARESKENDSLCEKWLDVMRNDPT